MTSPRNSPQNFQSQNFKANMIALINSIVCCLIFAIIRLHITGIFSLGYVPATFYFFINKQILTKNVVPDKAINENEEVDNSKNNQENYNYKNVVALSISFLKC